MKNSPVPLIALALLAGCVRYQPTPVSVSDRATQRMNATLDGAAIGTAVRRIAPDAPPASTGMDRLALFAALLEHDPKVAAARAAIATAEADARKNRQGPGPTFTLTSEYANDPSTSSPWLFGGAIDLPLDIGGQRKARLDRADLAVAMARSDYAEMLWSERMALRRALIDAEIARRQVALGEEIVALRDRQIAALERQVASGELAGAAVAPNRALRAQELRALEDARARVVAARTAITGILGVPASAIADIGLVWPEFDAPGAEPVAITPAMRVQAVSARADILKSLAAYDQTEADVRLEIAKQYPSISLAPGYTWERGLVKLPLSVNLALPSFDLNRAAIRSALAKRDEAGAVIEQAIAAAQAEIDAALVERAAALAALKRLRESELPQTKASADRAQAQLARGQIARAEWADAQLAELAARLGALDTLARIQAAEAALENGMRRPLEGPELMIKPDRLEARR
ncbi:TolC family protein [Sphingobium nicotianae]|uniref:TolC family protein n=1 Tax=Sphingobium nicotianae TaxID=2782607 RepID=A0A9X1DGB4_9SPHN|nr:TolC family protein [Sphingobium nicotianae]MBT2189427.1 TolC family protein [Sphingobium nicotianae]